MEILLMVLDTLQNMIAISVLSVSILVVQPDIKVFFIRTQFCILSMTHFQHFVSSRVTSSAISLRDQLNSATQMLANICSTKYMRCVKLGALEHTDTLSSCQVNCKIPVTGCQLYVFLSYWLWSVRTELYTIHMHTLQ